ncbi:MAG: hypothetical protein KatS3mg109_1535 [Pirellulaceae bacterium]|nr:MAG: hypothetical protein KatS3mg109_1535 [Pirellulaceae bacterium]GIW93292.1 MAG: hypothetical protein KatS3mg110_1333 [Pirellulaceae bacterium]
MQPLLAQVSSLPFDFSEDVSGYAAARFRQMEVWLTKLEEYLSRHSPDELRQLLERHSMQLPVASFQGGLFASGQAGQQAWGLFERRLALCRDWQIQTLVVAADVSGPIDEASAQQVIDRLSEAAHTAEKFGIRLALEFRANATLLNNLETAAAVVRRIGHPLLGLCLDTFHFHVGPSKLEDLRYLEPTWLFHVQLADLADVPRELAADAHRILPGEGDIAIPAILEHLQKIGYQGTVSIEMLNPQLWHVSPRQLAETARACFERLLVPRDRTASGGDRGSHTSQVG